MVKKGDKVKIIRRDITGLLCPYGIVTRVDGFLVFVKSVWSKHIIELYANEVELVTPTWASDMFDLPYLKCPYCGHKKKKHLNRRDKRECNRD